MNGGVVMMQGISGGMASAGSMSMPKNCGMQGMHGNPQTKQALNKADNNTPTPQQNNQPSDLLKSVKGNKIDVRI